jgi:hypothetical protein
MEFRLPFTPKPFLQKIEHQHQLFLAGSCFTEQIGAKLSNYKFKTIENPNGILFNPISISENIISYIDEKMYSENDLFLNNEIWGSWNHHTKFSGVNQAQALEKINQSQKAAHEFLKNTDWLIITLGSSYVYALENNKVVANCHKVPTDKFNKKLLSAMEVENSLQTLLKKLKSFNPNIKTIFTISPVRHLRDGFVENNRSKANLIAAVHELIATNENTFYFPSYELVTDDLRDYRFYAEDMVHPNYQATQYVWEKFTTACIDEQSLSIMKEIGIINSAKNHRPFNPTSNQHLQFLKTNLEKTLQLQRSNPYLDLTTELIFFESGINNF